MNPKITFIGGTHGDELVGVEVIKKLENYLTDKKVRGEINLLIANPLAVKEGKRFIDQDLNRLFSIDLIDNLKEKKNLNYEQERVTQIAPLLQNQDFVFDIHSTIKKGKSFVLIFDLEKQLDLARFFKPDFLVSTEKIFGRKRGRSEIFTIDRYVAYHGGTALTIETGWKDDLGKVDQVFNSCLAALSHLGVIDFDHDANKGSISQAPLIEIYEEKIIEREDFSWTKNYQNFSHLKKGETMAHAGGKPITASRDSLIIFPKAKPDVNGRICLLGKKETIFNSNPGPIQVPRQKIDIIL